MKCVIGIDLERRASSAITLVGRMKLPLDETILLHVTEPIQMSLPYSAYGMYVETTEIYDTLRQAGEEALKGAAEEASSFGLHPTTRLCEGFPTQSLIDTAEEAGAAVIAVTSTARSAIGAVCGGSVARGLAISAGQSVLVAREELPTDGGSLRAVFATDQSDYSAECVDLLIQLAPKGISHLTLLTVHERQKHEGLLSRIHGVDSKAALDQVDEHLAENGCAIADKLCANGISTISKVVDGHVEETIRHVMEETQADLLIVGSQGHGFIDRIMVGSTSLHEVIGERYPVLLLRPAKRP